MLLTRVYPLLKLTGGTSNQVIQTIRQSSHVINYRCPPPKPSKTCIIVAEGVQGFAWWWVLWHFWTEPEHIFGEFEFPDPSKWTDEELGIPSD